MENNRGEGVGGFAGSVIRVDTGGEGVGFGVRIDSGR